MATRTNPTPKSRARSLLLERYKQRGKHYSNLWLFYSPKTQSDWIASSDLEYFHAIWLEAQPDVVRYELHPKPVVVKVGNDNHKTEFDAMVWFSDRGPELREVKSAPEEAQPKRLRTIHQREAQMIAATQLGGTRRVVTGDDMQPHNLLIMNWMRVRPYMEATREYPMGEMRDLAALKLKTTPDTTLGELLSGVDKPLWPVFLSAVFRLHQQGVYATDLDSAPLSLSTRVYREEALQ
jgi:hypothetical protein